MRNTDLLSPLSQLANYFGPRPSSSSSAATSTHSYRDRAPSTLSRLSSSTTAVSPPHTPSSDMDRSPSIQWPFRGSGHLRTRSRSGTGTDTNATSASPITHTSSGSVSASTFSGFWARRGTWASRGHRHNASAATDLDIIPDYVVNYIRGETPESLAVKREMRRGPQSVRIHRHSRGFHSRTANFFIPGEVPEDAENLVTYQVDEKAPVNPGWSSGWRAGFVLAFGVVATILILIMVLFFAAIARSSSLIGQSPIYTGACEATRNLSYGLRIVIALISAAVLAAGNYMFQVLSSPTRTEVDRAHEQKKWLDIGIPSFRNMATISGSRTSCVSVLMLLITVTTVFVNSVIFVSQSSATYNMALVTESFPAGASFSSSAVTNAAGLSSAALSEIQTESTGYTNIPIEDCVGSFTDSLITPFDVLLLLTPNTSSTSSSLLATAATGSLLIEWASVTRNSININDTQITSCLVRDAKAEETCSVVLNNALLATTALSTLLLTMAVAAITLVMAKFQPLATLGDALASFLDVPDDSTRGACLLTKNDVKNGRWGNNDPKYYVPADHYWLMTPSLVRWILWTVFFIVPFILALVALVLGITNSPLHAMSSFGLPSPSQTMPMTIGVDAISIIASLPQIFVIALYISTDALLSTYFLSHELSEYAVASNPRPLRLSTSTLRGAQTSSIYLTLPRPVSWVLYIFFAGISFVTAQSLFTVVITFNEAPYATTAVTSTTHEAIYAIGMSGVGCLALVSLLLVLTGLVIGFGLRRADPSPTTVEGTPAGNPLILRGGSCSAVLSAKCQGAVGDVGAKAIAWGVVEEVDGMTVGHAGFDYREVRSLKKGGVYA